MWKRLDHPNVVDFLGFSTGASTFSLIYHWVSNGSLFNYVRGDPDVDKLGLVSGYPQSGRRRVERSWSFLDVSCRMSLAGWPTCISMI